MTIFGAISWTSVQEFEERRRKFGLSNWRAAACNGETSRTKYIQSNIGQRESKVLRRVYEIKIINAYYSILKSLK